MITAFSINCKIDYMSKMTERSLENCFAIVMRHAWTCLVRYIIINIAWFDPLVYILHIMELHNMRHLKKKIQYVQQ